MLLSDKHPPFPAVAVQCWNSGAVHGAETTYTLNRVRSLKDLQIKPSETTTYSQWGWLDSYTYKLQAFPFKMWRVVEISINQTQSHTVVFR